MLYTVHLRIILLIFSVKDPFICDSQLLLAVLALRHRRFKDGGISLQGLRPKYQPPLNTSLVRGGRGRIF